MPVLLPSFSFSFTQRVTHAVVMTSASPVGCVLVAVKGQGCFMRSASKEAAEETKVSASSVTDSAQANFTESVEASHSSHDVSQRIAQKLGTLFLHLYVFPSYRVVTVLTAFVVRVRACVRVVVCGRGNGRACAHGQPVQVRDCGSR
jgi:hypothetical protein